MIRAEWLHVKGKYLALSFPYIMHSLIPQKNVSTDIEIFLKRRFRLTYVFAEAFTNYTELLKTMRYPFRRHTQHFSKIFCDYFRLSYASSNLQAYGIEFYMPWKTDLRVEY